MLAILLTIAFFAASAHAGIPGFSCPPGLRCIIIGPITLPFTTTYTNPYYAPLSGPSTLSTSQISQTTQVSLHNNATDLWLITCPQAPQQVSSGTSQYFYTGAAAFIAGDACLANPQPPLTSSIWSAVVYDVAKLVAPPKARTTASVVGFHSITAALQMLDVRGGCGLARHASPAIKAAAPV